MSVCQCCNTSAVARAVAIGCSEVALQVNVSVVRALGGTKYPGWDKIFWGGIKYPGWDKISRGWDKISWGWDKIFWGGIKYSGGAIKYSRGGIKYSGVE